MGDGVGKISRETFDRYIYISPYVSAGIGTLHDAEKWSFEHVQGVWNIGSHTIAHRYCGTSAV